MIDIPRDAQTRLYELTYLLPPTLTESELAAAKKTIDALVAKHSGTLVVTENWGKRDLAYRIRFGSARQTQAVYVHVVIEFAPENAFKFEKELYLQDGIMRHLFVVSDAEGKDAVETSPNAAV